MRLAARLTALLVLVGLLTGCGALPKPREMGDMALLRTMGVDEGTVTVATGEPAQVLSAQSDTLRGAAVDIQGMSDHYVFFGYIDQLLLGQSMAEGGAMPVLDWFARDVELSLSAQLWLIREDTAQRAVESGGEKGVEERLSTLRMDGKLGVGSIPRTAGEVYSDLLEQGSAYVPTLMVGEEKAGLVAGGYGVLRQEGLAGLLTGEEAKGLELLAGKPAEDVLVTEGGAVQVYRAVTTSAMGQGGELKVLCRIWCRLEENDRPLTKKEQGELEQQVEREEARRIRRTLNRLQSWQTDCLGLGPRAGLLMPGRWARVAERWPERFGEQSIDLRVQVELMK